MKDTVVPLAPKVRIPESMDVPAPRGEWSSLQAWWSCLELACASRRAAGLLGTAASTFLEEPYCASIHFCRCSRAFATCSGVFWLRPVVGRGELQGEPPVGMRMLFAAPPARLNATIAAP